MASQLTLRSIPFFVASCVDDEQFDTSYYSKWIAYTLIVPKGTAQSTKFLLKAAGKAKSKCLWIIDDNATWFTLWADIGEGTRRSLPLTKEQFEAWLDAAEKSMKQEDAVACSVRSTERGHLLQEKHLVFKQGDRHAARSRDSLPVITSHHKNQGLLYGACTGWNVPKALKIQAVLPGNGTKKHMNTICDTEVTVKCQILNVPYLRYLSV